MAKKIVVVDDEPDILKVVVFRLKKLGCEIVTATNGADGLARIREHHPDVILLDYRLPDTDGLEIARGLRQDAAFAKTPIILISASSAADITEALEAASVNDYVVKPFDPEKLLATVRKYL